MMSEYFLKPIVKTYMTKYKGIEEIKKTSTSGLVDTYTITLTDGTTSTFTVTNGEKGDAGSTTDTGETSADTSTMCGAIRYCMEKLKTYDPTSIILVLLPPQRAEGNDSQEKVNAVIKSIVNSYGVKTLDIYHESGIVPNTKIANVNYLTDGLHLNKNGYTVLGNILSSEIKYLLRI